MTVPFENPDKYPANGLIDKNTYYHSGNIWIYPSSNGVDKGKVQLELNLRNVSINITDKNYVVEPNPGGYDISYDSDKDRIIIQPGKAKINGFEVNTDEVVEYRLPLEEELYTGTKYAHKYNYPKEGKQYALLCLHTLFDSLENLSGNVQVGDTWYCEGINVCYVDAETYEANEQEYLLLGGVTLNGDVKIDDEKYLRMDAKYVLVRMVPDDETGVPPLQSTDLLTFVNNYMHAYWVSKAGDHEYGNLTLRKKPDKYLDPLFDYKSEEPLGDDTYAIKIARRDIVSAITDNPEACQEGYINVKKCDYLECHTEGYERRTNMIPLGMYFTDNMKDTVDDAIDRSWQKYNAFIGYSDWGNKNEDFPLYPQNFYQNALMLSTSNLSNVDFDHLGNDLMNKAGNYKLGNIVFNGHGFRHEDNDYTDQNVLFSFAKDEMYVGALNKLNETQNDLYSSEHSIATSYKLDSDIDHFRINISAQPKKQQIEFQTKEQFASIHLRDDEEKPASKHWKNVLDISENLEIQNINGDGGNVWAKGYIVAGTRKNVTNVDNTGDNPVGQSDPIGDDPSLIEVPDFANTGGYRKLQPGDIIATQIWTSVFNDESEMFNVDIQNLEESAIGMIVAIDKDGKYKIADRHKKHKVIGIVSENPAICMGSNGNLPIVMSGRSKVKVVNSNKIKIGDYIGLSRKKVGYGQRILSKNSKYFCGIVTAILNKNEVEIFVR